MTWTQDSGTTQEGWRRLSVVTDDTGGVDFQLAIDDQYPWPVLDHDPLTVVDAPQETP